MSLFATGSHGEPFMVRTNPHSKHLDHHHGKLDPFLTWIMRGGKLVGLTKALGMI